MRCHFFLHYGWFFQNLGKEAVRTFMHTTVLLRKASLWGCYKPRHVTKWDVILLATIQYLKNKQKIVHELVTSMSKRSMFQYFFWTTKRKADVIGFRQGAKKNGIDNFTKKVISWILYIRFYSFLLSAIRSQNECNLQLNAMQWFENAILLCFCYVCASSSVFRSDWEAKTWRDQGCTSSRDRSWWLEGY